MTDVTPIVSMLAMIGLVAFIVWLVLRRPAEVRRRFRCPVCGEHQWSSGPPFVVGRCVGCGFTWKRIDDDRYIGRID